MELHVLYITKLVLVRTTYVVVPTKLQRTTRVVRSWSTYVVVPTKLAANNSSCSQLVCEQLELFAVPTTYVVVPTKLQRTTRVVRSWSTYVVVPTKLAANNSSCSQLVMHGDSRASVNSTCMKIGWPAGWLRLPSPAKLQQASLGAPSCLPGRHRREFSSHPPHLRKVQYRTHINYRASC